MIVSELPPSRLLGSFATVIHTLAFNCFVSTARNGWLLNRWVTAIYDGDPGLDLHCQLCGSFSYIRGISAEASLAAHREATRQLNSFGEDGFRLDVAIRAILEYLDEKRIIEG